jgi:energy-coupling factor transporter ATP-binding protein EcfA2
MDPLELASAIRDLTRWAEAHAPDPEPELRRRLREHLGEDPAALTVVSERLTTYEHPNVQVALDAWTAGAGAGVEVLGLSIEHGFRAGLAELAQRGGSDYGPEPGPPEYRPIDVGDRTISALGAGLLLVTEGDRRLAVLLGPAGNDDEHSGFVLEAMAPRREDAEAWLRELKDLMSRHNVYRGKVLEFGGGPNPFRAPPLSVRRLPSVSRDRIITAGDELERIERHTAGLARHRAALRAAGRHIKRGLLLHGPPGTGKTLTVMYLAGLMPERTVILLSGQGLGAINAAATLARQLEPAMIVLEDVDLVAMDRMHFATNPLLFELLNAMDGLAEDADLIFVLTTNRADLLEPALASRPGRIDLAVELPLPDAAARGQLIALYAEGLDLEPGDHAEVVAATDGVSPAFIRELMRRAALIGAEEERRVTDADLLRALGEVRPSGDRLTSSLLGAERPPEPPARSPSPFGDELEDDDDLDEDDD